ncbi:MAG: polysaccharide deacetylase family protein [Cyanobacteria bacterium P01_A01_bin.40]
MLIISKIKFFYYLVRSALKLIIKNFNPILSVSQTWNLSKRLIIIDTRLYWTSFCAGIAINQDKDPSYSLSWLANKVEPHPCSIYVSSYQIAEAFIQGLLVSSKIPQDEFAVLWQQLADPIEQFFCVLEKTNKGIWLDLRDRPVMGKIILKDLVSIRPIIIGSIYATQVEITQEIADLMLPKEVNLLYCSVDLEGKEIGTIELPIIDGMVSSLVLKDSIASEFYREILACFLNKKANNQQFRQYSKHDINWKSILHELWEINTNQEQLINTQSLVINKAEKVSQENDLLVIEISDEFTPRKVNSELIDILITIGGATIGTITITVPSKTLTCQTWRDAVAAVSNLELCIVAVREGLLCQPLTPEASLQERLVRSATASKNRYNPLINLASDENILVLGRRHQEIVGTSAARWAMLPKATSTELISVALNTGESVIQTPENPERATRVFYAPELTLTSLASKQEKEKIINPDQHQLAATTSTQTEKLPILMYHEIIPKHSSEQPARWKLTAAAFAEQLRYLRDRGFYSVTLDDWRIAIMNQKPLPGNAVLITFDDGYQSFFDCAFPILKEYGFSATVFLITNKIGTQLENYQLMGWQEIEQLQAAGIEFGSHSANHPSLTVLTYEEVVREGLRSRLIIEQKLGTKIKAFAYPYGDVNPLVRHLIGACGYIFGLDVGLERSTLEDSLLKLSRIEIEGTDNLQQFTVKIGA